MAYFEECPTCLNDVLGREYLQHVVDAKKACDADADGSLPGREIRLYPKEAQHMCETLALRTGEKVTGSLADTNAGAATKPFMDITDLQKTPLNGYGMTRVSEDGKLYLITKSEHYQAVLGHKFPGYQMLAMAEQLGIPNATHNNTRGYITRLLERELIRTANGIAKGDDAALEAVLASEEQHTLNRVINIMTGSLAVEAGIKMMLARFYKNLKSFETPQYEGKVPVFLVIGDNNGVREANYHGTTIFAQMFRDIWPGLLARMEQADILKVVPVAINNIEDFAQKIETYNTGKYKTAGFLHEIVLMNYGAVNLTKDFLQEAYLLCDETDTPTLVDEIQSCMWYSGLYLFRKYDLRPDFAVVGKGFPGGKNGAARIMTTSKMDNMCQFGALITNGQDEIASLSYLIGMEWVGRNERQIDEMGEYIMRRMDAVRKKSNGKITAIEGQGHLLGVHFHHVQEAERLVKKLNGECIDTSAHLYKENCPPAVLFKIPLIITKPVVDFLTEAIERALEKD